MLADPECKLTRPIRINCDLIEVSNGWCFSISMRQFEVNPVKECETPRGFIEYVFFLDETYTKLLDPDDWKTLTQGGLTANDRKYKSSAVTVIRNVDQCS